MRKLGRVIWRSLWLGLTVVGAFLRFGFLYLRCGGRPSIRQRAECLHRSSIRTLRVFVDQVEVIGARPTSGLLVGNHLSYVDILLLSSLNPAVFVSKSEVKNWPVFGVFSRLGGTVFVRRAKRGEVGQTAEQIHALLKDGQLVILFPEGTSSGGETVLPFKSSLLESAVGQKCKLTAACLHYSLADGVVADDVCYWRDMTFLPHFLKLLGKEFVKARVSFFEIQQPADDRKELAKQLHNEVSRLHSASP